MYKANPGQKKMKKVLKRDEITRFFTYSGSRSGKTFELVRAVILRALISKESRHVIIRRHFAQAKKFIWMDTIPSVVDICFPELKKAINYDKSDYYVKLPNGSEIWIGGLDDKERADKILGGEYNTIYFNEVSEISYHSVKTALTRLAKLNKKFDGRKLINKAFFDCNPPAKSHWSYKWFIEQIDPETRGKLTTDNQSVIQLHPWDNKENLPEQYLNELENMTGDERKRFFEGEYQDEIKGALWSENMINRTRLHEFPELVRINVAVDPAMSTTQQSDETGITVQAECVYGHYYVLDDLSGHYSPAEWADKAISAFRKWEADRIIGEVNNGGDLVESNITNRYSAAPVTQVRASRGKMKRAEPIAALYERGIVHHIGEFVELEYQMTNYTGDPNEESPDRMDAVVWGLTDLTEGEEQEQMIYYDDGYQISEV